MEALFEAVFVAGVAVVALSLVGVLVQRVTPRLLLILTGALACASAVATAALGIDLVSDFASTDALVLAAAGLALCAVAEAGLFALSRGLIRLRQEERLIAAGEAHIEAVLAASAKERAAELDRYVGSDAIVPHKAGWVTEARHDAGIVYTPEGAFVAVVMTYTGSDAGLPSDELAGHVAQAARERFEAEREEAGGGSGTSSVAG